MSETAAGTPDGNDAGSGGAGSGGAGRGVRIALAVSVALNLAVAGLFAGSFLKDHDGGGPREVREIGFGPFGEALSREDRKALRKMLFTRLPEMKQARQEAAQDAQNLLAVLRATPFDPAQLSAVMEAQRQRMAGRLEVGQGLMRDLLVAMTPEARLAFADRLEQQLRRGGKDKDKPPPPPPNP